MSVDTHQTRARPDAHLDRRPEDGPPLAGVRELLGTPAAAPASRRELRGHVTTGAVPASERGPSPDVHDERLRSRVRARPDRASAHGLW
ncbi:hypothetical protein QQY24_26245 [Streptomyces sp. TG1A-8]|uniref:hypothetical protein n=1 Tax=Streptomyces sp. TG1A-8 TaxID=3051385 RepID=UPI00265C1831|nr:hypothetical protein [Streptomyces sp. TG1A-8]MDO0928743.1 hypothetical protein [Streptomyces sp. TG1A-8]